MADIDVVEVLRALLPAADKAEILQDFDLMGHRRPRQMGLFRELPDPHARLARCLHQGKQNQLPCLVHDRGENWLHVLKIGQDALDLCFVFLYGFSPYSAVLWFELLNDVVIIPVPAAIAILGKKDETKPSSDVSGPDLP